MFPNLQSGSDGKSEDQGAYIPIPITVPYSDAAASACTAAGQRHRKAKKARKRIESEDNKCLDWACVGRLKDIVEAVNGKFSAGLPFNSTSDVSPYVAVTCRRCCTTRPNTRLSAHPRIHTHG